MKFNPRPYQKIALRHMLTHDRCALFAQPGMGKTACGLGYISALADLGVVGKRQQSTALVIATRRIAETVWTQEADKWDEFQHLESAWLTGSLPIERRRNLLKQLHYFDFIAINYEMLPWLRKALGQYWPFPVVVADESTALKNFRPNARQHGQRSRALAVPAADERLIRHMVLMSGTPQPNGYADLWGQLWFIDKGKRLGGSFDAYQQRYFKLTNYDAENPHKMRWEVNKEAIPFIRERIRDVCLSLRTEDWLDVREANHQTIQVGLPEKARREYDYMLSEGVASLDLVSDPVARAGTAKAVGMKLHQMTQGFMYETDGVTHLIHEEKLDALERLRDELQEPMLVAYTFKADLEALRRRFPEGVELREKGAIDRWNAGELPMMFLHPKSAGHGLNLQHGGRNIVFYGLDWPTDGHDQVIERIGPARQLQAGYDRVVNVYTIEAKNTLDEVIRKKHRKRSGEQNALMEYLQGQQKEKAA